MPCRLYLVNCLAINSSYLIPRFYPLQFATVGLYFDGMATMHIRSYVMTPWQITYWPEPRCSSTALGLPAQSIGVNKGNLDVLCVAFVLFLVSFVALVPVHGEMVFLGPTDLLLQLSN